jgi:2-phosphoglycerate kinase
MDKLHDICFMIPDGLIVFISGVPGVGKTTISYELLKRYDVFRIIEETDLIREALRGYNEYLKEKFKEDIQFIFNNIEIYGHNKLLTIDEAIQQCLFMKSSFEHIVARQQRKGISSIINGVHVIPEILDGLVGNKNIVYINLYINNEQEIHRRIADRNPHSYMLNHIPFIFRTNNDLQKSTLELSNKASHIFHNIDVTEHSINDTVNIIAECIKKRISM